MAIVEVKVPQLSESVAEATLLQWKKKVGEAVTADEILIEIETDKVVLECPAPAGGVLVEILQATAPPWPPSSPSRASTPLPWPAPPWPPPPLHRRLPLRRPLWPLPLRFPTARLAWPCPLPPS